MNMRKKHTIEDMQKLAKNRGGTCLSKDYINKEIKLKWQCKEGHVWDATTGNVKNNQSWCPYCRGWYKTIEDMQKLAEKKGGKCVSEKFIAMHKKLKWQCGNDHIWEATPDNIKYGWWCPYCSHHIRRTIDEMKQLAISKNGVCLSDQIITTHHKLKWRCSEGHEWEATPHSVMSGTWCRKCAGLEKLSIEEMQKRAQKKGGKCLSEKYVNSQTKLEWQCNKGHIWPAKPSDIRQGRWCPICWQNRRGKNLRHHIDDMHKLANSKGGKCLSTSYVNVNTKLTWQCKESHTWETKPNEIIQGRWCPVCSEGVSERVCRKFFEEIFKAKFPKIKPIWLINSRGNRMELDGYCKKLELAFEYQGKQHYESSTFFNTRQPLDQRKQDDEQKRTLCKSHGVNLLEVPYTVDYEKMSEWIIQECMKNGIIIKETDYLDYKNFDIYSPQKIKEMQEIARSKGGECLSPSYINKEAKIQWKCNVNHVWWARAGEIKRGQWCPKCGVKRRSDLRRSNIQEMQEIARKKGGKCLSTVYMNNNTKLEWQCSKGHVWKALPANVKFTTWCPYCSNRMPYRTILTLNDMQKTAEEKGGKCLSNKYLGNRIPLRWQCKNGHIWETRPQNIREGSWCPTCARRRKK